MIPHSEQTETCADAPDSSLTSPGLPTSTLSKGAQERSFTSTKLFQDTAEMPPTSESDHFNKKFESLTHTSAPAPVTPPRKRNSTPRHPVTPIKPPQTSAAASDVTAVPDRATESEENEPAPDASSHCSPVVQTDASERTREPIVDWSKDFSKPQPRTATPPPPRPQIKLLETSLERSGGTARVSLISPDGTRVLSSRTGSGFPDDAPLSEVPSTTCGPAAWSPAPTRATVPLPPTPVLSIPPLVVQPDLRTEMPSLEQAESHSSSRPEPMPEEVRLFAKNLAEALCTSRRARREGAQMGGFLYGIANIIRSYIPVLHCCGSFDFAKNDNTEDMVRLMALAPHPRDPDLLYVADQTRVWCLNINGDKCVIAGGVEKGMVDGPALDARFRCIGDMVIDADCSIYLTDYPNNRIRVLDLDTRNPTVRTVAGSGYTTEPVSGSGTQAMFAFPAGITMDRSRRYLYCTDSSYVRRIKLPPPGMPATPENVKVENVVKNNGESLYGLEFDRNRGVLLATSVSGIYKVDPREDLLPGTPRIEKIIQKMPYTSTPVCDPWSDMILLNGYDNEALHFLQYNALKKQWQRSDTGIKTEFPLLTWHPRSDHIWASSTKTKLIAVEVW